MTLRFLFATGICCTILFSSCSKENTPPELAPLPGGSPDSLKPAIPENKVDRHALLQLVNGLRSRGCNCADKSMPPAPPVLWNVQLETAAWLHSKDMFEHNYFNHRGLNGSTPGSRLDAAGYNWTSYAENIAMGNMVEQAVVLGWLNSPEHCQNLMSQTVRELGVGRKEQYWTLLLGRRSISEVN